MSALSSRDRDMLLKGELVVLSDVVGRVTEKRVRLFPGSPEFAPEDLLLDGASVDIFKSYTFVIISVMMSIQATLNIFEGCRLKLSNQALLCVIYPDSGHEFRSEVSHRWSFMALWTQRRAQSTLRTSGVG